MGVPLPPYDGEAEAGCGGTGRVPHGSFSHQKRQGALEEEKRKLCEEWHVACQNGNKKLARLLLKDGVDVQATVGIQTQTCCLVLQ